MPDELLTTLNLTPADIPGLPANARKRLVAFLIRWEHHAQAQLCLQQLLATHSHSVTVYDNLARVFLAQDQPHHALETMRRRQALRTCATSRALEARAYMAAGELDTAVAMARRLLTDHPDMLTLWSLQTDLCLAAGDFEGAEAALEQRESLRPEASATARDRARLLLARGELDQALLWARTALVRAERDGRQPSVELLRLLGSLYEATGQEAQAAANATRLGDRQRQELEALRECLGLPSAAGPSLPGAQLPAHPADAATVHPAQQVGAPLHAEVIAGAADLTPEERLGLDASLRRYFAFEAFRPGQLDVIAAVLRSESVLAVMPTGAGKSLCYQLASLLLPGTTLVISPLIALMKDQLDGLPADVALQATAVNHTLDGSELATRLERAAAGDYRLLYAAPERLRQWPFVHALRQAGVSLLVVDEAHCVSLWGHDFRPDYRFIARAWRELGQPPVLAMTATATPRVRDDIRATLGNMRLVATDVHRPNLHFEAREFGNDLQKQNALRVLCHELGGSGIIYAPTRVKCEELAGMLRRSGVSAGHYHAGIPDRAAAQDRFMGDEMRVVVATIAFGMGLDKADVRFIVHYSPPKALENYYQEAGRAGRDGQLARCILFHTSADKANLTRWTRQNALQIDFLRRVYRAIQNRLGQADVALLSTADLERDLTADETQVRVAIHFLETAGLVWRGFDLPRTATLALKRRSDSEPPDLSRVIETARLAPGQSVARDLLALSRQSGLDPRTIERQLLAWDDAGWLRYRGIGRDMLLALPQPPPDSEQRVNALLADYHAGQVGRMTEMMAYATTRGCRHHYISAYFGGRPIEHCQACDNCSGRRAQPSRRVPVERGIRPSPYQTVAQPAGPQDLTAIILQSVAELPFPLGCTGLARALRGLPSSPVQADEFPRFGSLAGHSTESIERFAAALVDRGMLAYTQKGRYRLLRLTGAGRSCLAAAAKRPPAETSGEGLSPPRGRPRPVSPSKQNEPEQPLAERDLALFQQLRAWRRAQAAQAGVPPYVVFHDSVLKRIAVSRPTTLRQLLALRGIGPRKLEQYGPAVLEQVARYAGTAPKTET